MDGKKRYAIFREAERILITDDPPICPLYYFVGIQLYDPENTTAPATTVIAVFRSRS